MRWITTSFAFGIALILGFAVGAEAQTGNIAGQVVDAESGDPLPGVNVVLVGTQQGATTDQNGNYRILNVQPGTYSVRASFVGFATQTIEGVEVNIDLTSQIDFELQEQTQELQEVTVQAQERVVKADISSSQINVSTEDVENMPINDLESVVGLQAGVRPNLQIRGSSRDEVDVRLDGLSLSGSRDNSPYSNVSYTSVQQVQVQTGGFNAEYGNVRSGMVNMVSREGPRNRYTADVIARYTPPQKKHFGRSPSDPNSYWLRPYMDPEVAFEGTSNWDDFTRRQYPDFVGYNAFSEQWNNDEDPNNDLTPEQIQEVVKWYHRRDVGVQGPDYTFDGSIGGPVPGISDALGDLRFFASYRDEFSNYIHPFSRDGYDAYNAQLKLTSNVSTSIKVNLQLMQGLESGTNCKRVPDSPGPNPCRYGDRGFTRTFDPSYNDIFAEGVRSVTDIERRMAALSWTHTLGASTFYEIKLQRFATEYDTHPLEPGDPTTIHQIGGMELDQKPFGFWYEAWDTPVTSMDVGGHAAEPRDTTTVGEWMARFDITSQLDQYNQVKAGLQFKSAHNDVRYGHIDFLVNPDDVRARWEETPLYGSAYVQDKIEYLGMIANLGVRLDYQDANSRWWDYEDPFTEAFMGKNFEDMESMLDTAPIDPKWEVSPRLGVSFPVTEASKLYFNWGQFVQYLEPHKLYMLERMQTTNGVWRISNPGTPLPNTTAYELGYEQSFFDQYLVRVAGYYKDVKNETLWMDFNSRSGLIDYQSNFANQYRDIRGAEFSVYKNVGDWIRGFVNYTYQVETTGQFGLPAYFENPVTQATFEQTTGANFPFRPVPQPFARISVDFITPQEFGPEWGGSFHPIANWRLNLLGRWRKGDYFTYTGDISAPGVVNNMHWEDWKMVDMRLMREFVLGGLEAQFYVDVDNIFNIKNFNPGSFEGSRDFENYMNSLHLKEEFVEDIPGWDAETGDDIPGELDPEKIYDPETGEGYIDPPNAKGFWHLWPRRYKLGLRFSF